jgi:hypothetical protein
MNNTTSYITQNELKKALRDIINKLQNNLDKITDYVLTEELYTIKKDTPHFLIRYLVPTTNLEHVIYSLIGKCCIQTELMSAESSYICLNSLISYAEFFYNRQEELLSNYSELSKACSKEYEQLKDIICDNKTNTKISLDILFEKIKKQCDYNEIIYTVLWEAIQMAGLEGNIRTESSTTNNSYVVELKYGYNFKLKPYKAILDPTTKTWDRTNVKVLVVDGIVERVSEIHNMLEGSRQSGMPMMMLAHGFSEEVIATLNANHARGIFDIMPIKLGDDVESLNVSNDVAITCGTDIISCLKGDMLSLKEYKDIAIVENVRCTENEVVIVNTSSKASVNVRINMLLEKKKEPSCFSDISNLYDARIKSLLAHSVIISLPTTLSEMEKNDIRTKIDICLRTTRTLLQYGITNIDKLYELYNPPTNTIISYAIKKTIKHISEKIKDKDVSALSIYLGLTRSCDLMLQMMLASGVLLKS